MRVGADYQARIPDFDPGKYLFKIIFWLLAHWQIMVCCMRWLYSKWTCILCMWPAFVKVKGVGFPSIFFTLKTFCAAYLWSLKLCVRPVFDLCKLWWERPQIHGEEGGFYFLGKKQEASPSPLISFNVVSVIGWERDLYFKNAASPFVYIYLCLDFLLYSSYGTLNLRVLYIRFMLTMWWVWRVILTSVSLAFHFRSRIVIGIIYQQHLFSFLAVATRKHCWLPCYQYLFLTWQLIIYLFICAALFS